MYGKRIPLANVAGFEVRLDPSWIFLAILISWSLAEGYFPHRYPSLSPLAWWIMGIAGAAGLVASILLHELGHSLVARRFGIRIRGITLFLFGGMAEVAGEPETPKAEFLMAAVGPIVSLVLGGILYAWSSLLSKLGWPDAVLGVVSYLGTVNLVLALFNLVPAFPLDGGRVLRSALWAWKGNFMDATRIASRGGSLFGIVLIVIGILDVFRGNFLGGMWMFLIGLFLRSAARMSYQQVLVQHSLQGETIRRYMNKNPITVSPGISIQEFVDDYLFQHQHKMFPVVDQGRLIGCVKMAALKQVPRSEWGHRKVGELAGACPSTAIVRPESDARQALLSMQQSDSHCLLVAEGDRLLGIVGLRDMLQKLAFKMELENHEAIAA